MSKQKENELISSRSSQTDALDLEKGEKLPDSEAAVDMKACDYHLVHSSLLTNIPESGKSEPRRRNRLRTRKTPQSQIHQERRTSSGEVPVDRSQARPCRLGHTRRPFEPKKFPAQEQAVHPLSRFRHHIPLTSCIVYLCTWNSLRQCGLQQHVATAG